MTMIAVRPVAILSILIACAHLSVAGEAPNRITMSDFPVVSKRAIFFEDRINAKDPAVRKRVVLEVCYFFDVPSPEYVAFLRRMMRDADPAVRGQAIRKLHAMWVPIAVEDLPRTFTGEHEGQVVDLEQKDAIARLLKECEQGQASSAYVLGLLRRKEAVPLFRQLAESRNIYARYTAARALIDCGDRDGARPILEGIIRSQLAIYAGRSEGREPFYAASSCRALIELGEDERKDGLKKLIALTGYMERSELPNDSAHLPAVRQCLASVTGHYFLSDDEANGWFERKYGK
jgi:hypothetical protein